MLNGHAGRGLGAVAPGRQRVFDLPGDELDRHDGHVPGNGHHARLVRLKPHVHAAGTNLCQLDWTGCKARGWAMRGAPPPATLPPAPVCGAGTPDSHHHHCRRRRRRHHRLPEKQYLNATLRAWKGLADMVTANGTVHGVCMGTGIEPDVDGYNQRGTDYWQSSPGGVGIVLKAAARMTRLMQFVRRKA